MQNVRWWLRVLAATCVAWLSLVHGEYTAKDAVVILTEANFEKEVLQSPDYWLVEFYAPWCGHCKKLEPQFKAAAKKLKKFARLGVVDATEHQALAQKYNIQGYPTLKEFGKNKKKPTDYQGGRTKKEIVQYVKNSEVAKQLGVSGVSVATITSDTMYPFLLQDDRVPVAVFFGRKKENARKGNAAPSWLGAIGQQLAKSEKSKKASSRIAFVPGSDEKLAELFGITDKLPAMVVIDPKASTFIVADVAKLDQSSATKFLAKIIKEGASARDAWTAMPSLPRPEVSRKTPRTKLQSLSAESIAKCVQKKGKMCVVVRVPTENQETAESKLAALAKQYRRDPLVFFAADDKSSVLSKLLAMLSVPEDTTALVLKPGRQLKFAHNADAKEFATFVDKLVEGTIHFASVPQGISGLKTALKEAPQPEDTEPASSHEEL